jgi:hypothetical protein
MIRMLLMAKGVPSADGTLFFIPRHEEEHTMTRPQATPKQPAQDPKPISLRYTCATNGEQVGLSHYLMAEAQKDK